MRRGRTEISDARAAVFFFPFSPGKSPVKCAPKPQLRERRKKKRRRSETASGKTFATRD